MTKWTINFTKKSQKELQKLDRPIQTQIVAELNRILLLNNPREVGKSLTGGLSGLWRYRVGDYRVVAELEDSIFTVIVVRIGHRKQIYD